MKYARCFLTLLACAGLLGASAMNASWFSKKEEKDFTIQQKKKLQEFADSKVTIGEFKKVKKIGGLVFNIDSLKERVRNVEILFGDRRRFGVYAAIQHVYGSDKKEKEFLSNDECLKEFVVDLQGLKGFSNSSMNLLKWYDSLKKITEKLQLQMERQKEERKREGKELERLMKDNQKVNEIGRRLLDKRFNNALEEFQKESVAMELRIEELEKISKDEMLNSKKFEDETKRLFGKTKDNQEVLLKFLQENEKRIKAFESPLSYDPIITNLDEDLSEYVDAAEKGGVFDNSLNQEKFRKDGLEWLKNKKRGSSGVFELSPLSSGVNDEFSTETKKFMEIVASCLKENDSDCITQVSSPEDDELRIPKYKRNSENLGTEIRKQNSGEESSDYSDDEDDVEEGGNESSDEESSEEEDDKEDDDEEEDDEKDDNQDEG